MKVLITIPTYKRITKLDRCLKSIYDQTHKDFHVFVVCDAGDYDTEDFLQKEWPSVSVKTFNNRGYVIRAWNYACSSYMREDTVFDGLMWCVDDVELYNDCLEQAVRSMKENFPDYDGIVGINQANEEKPNYKFKEYGQCIIGKNFIARYKEVDYQVSCPDYYFLNQDTEMYDFASSINKFKFCPFSRLKHYHPSQYREMMDATHAFSRDQGKKQFDEEIYNKRKSRGFIWGKNFNLINEKE